MPSKKHVKTLKKKLKKMFFRPYNRTGLKVLQQREENSNYNSIWAMFIWAQLFEVVLSHKP